MVNTFVIFSIIVFVFPILVASYLHVTTIDDLVLNKESQMYAGKGEVCVTPYIKINCAEGLKCVLISTQPHINGICLPEDPSNEKNYLEMTQYEMANGNLAQNNSN